MKEVALVLAGALPALVLQILNNWHQRKLELLKLRDEARVRAYGRLFALARKIRNTCFPLADLKREQFQHAMKGYLAKQPEPDYVYFSGRVMKLFDEIEGTYVCMTEPDLTMETDWEKFIEQELFDKAGVLETAVREELAL